MLSTKLNEAQLHKVVRILENGTYGSFFSAIGCAMQLADNTNKAKLLSVYGDFFTRVYENAIEAENI